MFRLYIKILLFFSFAITIKPQIQFDILDLARIEMSENGEGFFFAYTNSGDSDDKTFAWYKSSRFGLIENFLFFQQKK